MRAFDCSTGVCDYNSMTANHTHTVGGGKTTKRYFCLSPVDAKRLEVRPKGGGRQLEVVVRDLCEEEVVRNVAVGDVVVGVVNTPAVRSVHGFHCRGGEVEVGVVKRLTYPKNATKCEIAQYTRYKRGHKEEFVKGGGGDHKGD